MKNVTICKNSEALGKSAASYFAQLAEESVTRKGRFSVVLAGGNTPRSLYEALGKAPIRSEVPWGGVLIFWGDERLVPPDHPDSNFRMANEIFLSKVPIPDENIFAMPMKEKDPKLAAERYEDAIWDCLDPDEYEIPQFDLILLGIGADGHTASLFPDSSAVDEKEAWVVSTYVKQLDKIRLTLTLPILNQAKNIVFLASGKEKAPIIKTLLSSEPENTPCPAALIKPLSGNRTFFIDENAASELGK